MIPKDILSQINQDQARVIGDLTSGKKDLAKYLHSLDARFDPSVVATFDVRFGAASFITANGTWTVSSTLVIVSSAIMALLTIL